MGPKFPRNHFDGLDLNDHKSTPCDTEHINSQVVLNVEVCAGNVDDICNEIEFVIPHLARADRALPVTTVRFTFSIRRSEPNIYLSGMRSCQGQYCS